MATHFDDSDTGKPFGEVWGGGYLDGLSLDLNFLVTKMKRKQSFPHSHCGDEKAPSLCLVFPPSPFLSPPLALTGAQET